MNRFHTHFQLSATTVTSRPCGIGDDWPSKLNPRFTPGCFGFADGGGDCCANNTMPVVVGAVVVLVLLDEEEDRATF
jgi:hypothetical protein